MLSFYNQFENLNIEKWLAMAIHNKYDFSFNLKDIPNKNFLASFRKRYEAEFLRLENEDRGFNYDAYPSYAETPFEIEDGKETMPSTHAQNSQQTIVSSKPRGRPQNLLQNSLGSHKLPNSSASFVHKNHFDKSEVPKIAQVTYSFKTSKFACPSKAAKDEEEKETMYFKI
mmetsp:Transcript_5434/g.8415  ORF Transcript_5434/g.8415 Transcript_5434/m.8415 type:complete len:171 (-) Transcript_5434:595-1107(-)